MNLRIDLYSDLAGLECRTVKQDDMEKHILISYCLYLMSYDKKWDIPCFVHGGETCMEMMNNIVRLLK